MPERSHHRGVLETIPKTLLLLARLAMVSAILFYVATEAGGARASLLDPPRWIQPVAIAATGIMYVLAVLQWFLPDASRRARSVLSAAGFAIVNALLVVFSFDASQSLFLMAVLSLFELTQLVPRRWLLPLTGLVLANGLVSGLLIGPSMGADPHIAAIALRSLMCVGLVVAIDGFFRAVQEERKHVLESEELFRAIFTHAPVGMGIADVEDLRLTSVNEAYCDIVGYAERELLGMEIGALTVEEDFEAQRERMAAVVRGEGEGYRLRKRYRRKDGSLVTADVATTLVRDASGDPSYWIAQVNDVTAQIHQEERRREAERRYRVLAENFPDGAVFLFDRDRRLLLMEGRELDALGIEPRDADEPGDGLPPDLAARMQAWVDLAFEGEEARAQLLANGRAFQIRALAPPDEQGVPQSAIVVATDVSAHKELEERILHSNTELQRALSEMQLRNAESQTLSEMADLLAACVDEEEAHEVLARMVPRLFPRTIGGVYVMRSSRNQLQLAASWGAMPPDESTVRPDECWALRRGRKHVIDDVNREVICRHVTPLPSMSYVCVPMLAQGETLGVLHVRTLVGSERDRATSEQLTGPVAEQIGLSLANFRLRESLRLQSIQDPLTGLYNRRFMHEFLERQLDRARRHEQSLAVLMVDVDRLKITNDTLGHEAGDDLIRDVARVLSSGIRGGDIACRYGGDEFTIIATDAGLAEAAALAGRIRASLRELAPGIGLDPKHRPDLSIGIAAAPDHGWDGEGLLRKADEALYRAKAEGRGRVVVAATA